MSVKLVVAVERSKSGDYWMSTVDETGRKFFLESFEQEGTSLKETFDPYSGFYGTHVFKEITHIPIQGNDDTLTSYKVWRFLAIMGCYEVKATENENNFTIVVPSISKKTTFYATSNILFATLKNFEFVVTIPKSMLKWDSLIIYDMKR